MPKKKGYKRLPFSEEWRKNMRLAHIGRKLKEETKIKIGLANKGKKKPPFSEEHKRNISLAQIGRVGYWRDKELTAKEVGDKRILQEIPELEKQGFRCIPIGKVVPDIIGIKHNKVYAIEIDYTYKPNYAKYSNEIRKYFDDVIWILRKKK